MLSVFHHNFWEWNYQGQHQHVSRVRQVYWSGVHSYDSPEQVQQPRNRYDFSRDAKVSSALVGRWVWFLHASHSHQRVWWLAVDYCEDDIQSWYHLPEFHETMLTDLQYTEVRYCISKVEVACARTCLKPKVIRITPEIVMIEIQSSGVTCDSAWVSIDNSTWIQSYN